MTDRVELERFFSDTGPIKSGITRDGAPTKGNPFGKAATGGPLQPVYKLGLPRYVTAARCPGYVRAEAKADGYLMIALCGTGGQYRIPVIFTDAELLNRLPPTSLGEDVFLGDMAVWMEKRLAWTMANMPSADLEAYKVTNATHDPWTQDCVDQAANGTSYAIIWELAGLMTKYRPYYPGYRGGMFPHHYTRLQRISDGKVLAFDLYHRSAGVGTGAQVRFAEDPAAGQTKVKSWWKFW